MKNTRYYFITIAFIVLPFVIYLVALEKPLGLNTPITEVISKQVANTELPYRLTMSACFECHVDARHIARNPSGDIKAHYGALNQPEGTAGGKLLCIDCHSSLATESEYKLHINQSEQQPHYVPSISCQDCHGTLQSPPWDLPTRADLDNKNSNELLYLADGTPLTNIKKQKEQLILFSKTGKEIKITLLNQRVKNDNWSSEHVRQIKTVSSHTEQLQCTDCHADWAPPCYGCHESQ